MVFRSKVDLWLLLLMLALVAFSLALGLAALVQSPREALWVGVLTLSVGAALPLWLLVSTHYRIEGGTLIVRGGPFVWRIPVESITRIVPSRSLLSSPALSLDRLRIEYGTNRWILVSPADAEGFVLAVESAKGAPVR